MKRYGPYNLDGYIAWVIPDEQGVNRTVYEHRLVMEQQLGRALTTDEVVHHKDHNRSNNAPENLELTTRSEHAKLHGAERLIEMVEFTCPECGGPGFKQARNIRSNQGTKGRPGPFCGRQCAGRFNQRHQMAGISAVE